MDIKGKNRYKKPSISYFLILNLKNNKCPNIEIPIVAHSLGAVVRCILRI